MPEENKPQVWQIQEWFRTTPLEEVREFMGWARGVLEMRIEYAAEASGPVRTRKKRSDAGKKRLPDGSELPFDREQEQKHGKV